MRINRGIPITLLLMLYCLGAGHYPAHTCQASEQPSSRVERALKGWHFRPYCGLYCFYVYARMNNRQIAMDDIIRKEYVSDSREGSSLADLKQVAEDNGFYAEICSNLLDADLRRLPYAMILHVKDDLDAQDYNHYELLVGRGRSRVHLIDPPRSDRFVSYAKLSPRWGGDALLLSTDPIDLKSVNSARFHAWAIWGGLGLVCLVIARCVSRWGTRCEKPTTRGMVSRDLGQVAAILLLSCLFGFGCHFLKDSGFLVHPQAVAKLQDAYAGSFMPKLSLLEASKHHKNGSVFIDARRSQDYAHGHIENAINIPVTTPRQASVRMLRHVPDESDIVVYCQSAGCQYADEVAGILKREGYLNVSIFRGGWAE